MIKNVIFDLGGVLVELNPEKVIRSLFSEENSDYILHNIFFSKEWREVDRGTITPEAAFKKHIDRLETETFSKVLGIIENWNEYMPPFDDMYELIVRIKASGKKIYLLSNVPPYIHKMTGTLPALRLFDGFVASCDIKLLKPEKEIYEHLLTKFNLKADECFFIDDTRENVEAARRLGIRAHHFANHDTQALENALKENGVEI
ncbi:MAG: HAD family phosphatase [Clostridia bacterium]|nr:HAD family phosphatase [Clostridia bacterium]